MRLALLLIAVLLFGVGPATAKPLKVVTSFSILADMAKEIGGDEIETISLIKPDGDPHAFEPSPIDAKTVASADLVIVNGLGFEPWMERLLLSANYKGPVITASKGVHPRKLAPEERDQHDGTLDPHAWQSLKNGELYAANIESALAAALPGKSAEVRQRGEAYRARLAGLDEWVRKQFLDIPPEKRKIITSHDSFGYFGDAYGIKFFSPAGLNADSEPSAKSLGELVTQIKREKIRALFIENMSTPHIMNVLSRETGVKLGGKLYSDASSATADAPTYEAMFRHNVTALRAAMQENAGAPTRQ